MENNKTTTGLAPIVPKPVDLVPEVTLSASAENSVGNNGDVAPGSQATATIVQAVPVVAGASPIMAVPTTLVQMTAQQTVNGFCLFVSFFVDLGVLPFNALPNELLHGGKKQDGKSASGEGSNIPLPLSNPATVVPVMAPPKNVFDVELEKDPDHGLCMNLGLSNENQVRPLPPNMPYSFARLFTYCVAPLAPPIPSPKKKMCSLKYCM